MKGVLMKEFQSQLEQIIPVKELLFESTAGFGSYKKYMSHAIAHPAKMNSLTFHGTLGCYSKKSDSN